MLCHDPQRRQRPLTGTRSVPCVSARWSGMSGCIANPTPDTRHEPKFRADASDDHMRINLPEHVPSLSEPPSELHHPLSLLVALCYRGAHGRHHCSVYCRLLALPQREAVGDHLGLAPIKPVVLRPGQGRLSQTCRAAILDCRATRGILWVLQEMFLNDYPLENLHALQ